MRWMPPPSAARPTRGSVSPNVALSAAMMMLAALVVVAVAELFQLGFRGLTIDPFGAAALVAAAVGTMTYVASVSGARVTSTGVASLATVLALIDDFADDYLADTVRAEPTLIRLGYAVARDVARWLRGKQRGRRLRRASGS